MKSSKTFDPNAIAIVRQEREWPVDQEGFITRYRDEGAPLVEQNPVARYLREELGVQSVCIVQTAPLEESAWETLKQRVMTVALRVQNMHTVNIKTTKESVFVDFKDNYDKYILSFAFRLTHDHRVGSGYATYIARGADYFDEKNAESAGDNTASSNNESLDRIEFVAMLDRMKGLIDNDHSLRQLFDKHSINRSSKPLDPVAAEIALEVTDRWDERKEKFAGEPWIKNPARYVAHVYKKWIEAGTLKQAHLRHDPTLYMRYAKHISERPEDDLGLIQSPGGRKRKRRRLPPEPH